MKIRTIAAATALGMVLAACNQSAPDQGNQPQQNAPAGDFGGYGPFGTDAQQQQQQQNVPPGGGGAEHVVAGGGSSAPAEFQKLISSYLDAGASNMAAGWVTLPAVPDAITSLQAGGEHQWRIALRGGQRYALIGACDNECTDVDLIVMDGAGGHAGSDVLEDDYPLVTLQPATDGLYTVRIVLGACSVAPCYVGARLVRAP